MPTLINSVGVFAMKIISLLFLLLTLNACASTQGLHTSQESIKENMTQAEQAYQSGNYENAEKQFQAILKNSPDNIEARFRLANIALRQSRLSEAREHYHGVLERRPNHTKAHYNLALVNLLEAEQHFHFHTATAKDNAEQQTRLFALIDAIHAFLDQSVDDKKPKSALDSLADVIGQKSN